MWKNRARELVGHAALALPHGAREAALGALGREHGDFALLQALAARHGVSHFAVRGRHGVMRGSARDSVVLTGYATRGVWAERSLALFQDLFAPSGGTYIDVGANIGMTLVPLAADARVRCVGFEPEPENFENLSANLAANCPGRAVELHNAAVFSRADRLRFGVSADNPGDNRIASTGGAAALLDEAVRRYIEVEAVRLDDAVAGPLTGPVGVKVDTQGAEPFVVEGGARTLARADLLVMEFWPYGLAQLGGDVRVVLDFLAAQFPRLAIGPQEEGPLETSIPAGEACARLARLADAERANPAFYLDVVARRAAG